MSQEEVLALLMTFGPLRALEIAKTGMMNDKTARYGLNRLRRQGEVWLMKGQAQGHRGSLALWGAV